MIIPMLSQKIKELRTQKNLTQEKLSELSGISLRTLQRIEKNEGSPTADSIIKLSLALKQDITGLVEKDLEDNKQQIKILFLSALSFLIFPLLGAIVPSIIWVWEKDKLREFENSIKSLINFQITWVIVFSLTPFFIIPIIYYLLNVILTVIYTIISDNPLLYFRNSRDSHYFVWAILYIFNVYVIIRNTWFLDEKRKINFSPKIPFIK